MIGIRNISVAFLILITLTISCGKKEPAADKPGPETFLPATVSGGSLQRVSEIRTFVGESLWEYIDGGAELYYLYNFISVATADYKRGSVEILVDIYCFRSPDYAYGLYSMLRSGDAETIMLGVEGFVDPVSISFVKGDYVVKLIGYDDSIENSRAMTDLAQEIAGSIRGTAARPRTFQLFPDSGKIGTTDRLFAESFLGRQFLTDVYTQDYLIGTDSVTLFASADDAGTKFLKWSQLADQLAIKEPISGTLPFDEDHAFIVNNSFHGKIAVGLRSGKLIGIVRYSPGKNNFLLSWLETIR
ncbi:MAG: hypothetical protein JSV44_03330 [Candidatus Zixiibacteriota bacterium]|nr:MAG: hypothetical protein JSV44_03330 [candidate division Zixibacteria bacterium]